MPRRPLGPLGVRFAAAFIAVALFAVGVFSTAVLIADQGNVARLAATERDRAADEAEAVAANAYHSSAGWTAADLSPLSAFAAQAGVEFKVTDATGQLIASAKGNDPGGAGPLMVTKPVTDEGHPVGRITLGFPSGGVNPGDRHLRSSLFAAVAWSAGLAALGALIVAVLLARGVVRPLQRLLLAVRSLRLGESSPRVGPTAGPGELGELGRAFDVMADSVEQEDRLRRALVADVAHELRTPVAVMQAETEALADGFTAPSAEAMGSLHEEAVRLGRLVEDLQTLASAQAAGLEITRRPLDLGRVAADAAGVLISQFRRAGIDLHQDLPPTPAIGDPQRLHQVAVNLLTNAAKFTPAGGRVALRTFAEHGQAVLEVSDSGPGVPPGERAAVWDRFYRGSARSRGTGSGIGLAVVKALVAAHDGTVTVGESPTGGARFVIRVPAPDSAQQRGQDQP